MLVPGLLGGRVEEPASRRRRSSRPDQFTLTIDEIDTDSGSGRVTGTAGPVEVTALLTVSSLHFMERSVTGTLNVTTIFVSDGGVENVQSRALPARLPADEHPRVHVRAHGHAELRHVPGTVNREPEP